MWVDRVDGTVHLSCTTASINQSTSRFREELIGHQMGVINAEEPCFSEEQDLCVYIFRFTLNGLLSNMTPSTTKLTDVVSMMCGRWHYTLKRNIAIQECLTKSTLLSSSLVRMFLA